MIDAKDMFPDKEMVIGHIETSSGGVLLTDGGWEGDLPLSTQESVALDLNVDPGKIPVIAVRKNNKRFLILAVDDAISSSIISEAVTVIDKVEIPEEDEEKKEDK